MAASRAELADVLAESRRLGLLGPGNIEHHIDHGVGFGAALFGASQGDEEVEDVLIADLGAGGGVPGLPIAWANESLRLVLIDAAAKRTAFLVWAVVELGLSERVTVVRGRAEEIGRESSHRSRYDGVVARSFGPPSSTLECAAPLVRPGGRCVISEPPGGRTWVAEELARLGLTTCPAPPGYAVFARTGGVDDRYPRSAREQRARPVLPTTSPGDPGPTGKGGSPG